MKAIATLIILGAVGVFGSAFLGIYTAPGLEDFPTMESLGLGKDKASKEEAGQPASGIFQLNPDGKISERNNYLNQSKGQVAPGS